MKSAIDVNTRLVDGYIKLLNNLSLDNKLELISKLTLSVKSDISEKKESFYNSFGEWDSKESAEEIIKEIKDSRTFNRKIIGF